MGAHIFIVDENTFPVHRDRQFCGTGIPGIPSRYEKLLKDPGRYLPLIADIKACRVGDTVFFYERQKGFHGVYEITGKPFFDSTPISGVERYSKNIVGPEVPFRIPIKCINYFHIPIPEDLLFSTPQRESLFWMWFYRKIQGARGCNPIDPDGAEGLKELLVKVNAGFSTLPTIEPYPDTETNPLLLPIKGEDHMVYSEDALRAWLMENIDNKSKKDLREIFGPVEDIEWFANEIPYHVARRRIDILSIHKTSKYTSRPLRYKYSVVELKVEKATPYDIEKVLDYSNWVAERLCGGEREIVQPILIAHSFPKATIEKSKEISFGLREIKLFEYRVIDENEISFVEIT